jgi:4-aminobutyrate aminotransferase-like enzyme
MKNNTVDLYQNSPVTLSRREESRLLAIEKEVCSYGDTVHYAENPKLFSRCEGSFLYDSHGKPYLDLQMWYSAVNLGYGNPRINQALKDQLDRLPQLASQYLHREKIELAEKIAESAKRAFGLKGRVHFNVGGSQAVEDAMKLVRKHTGRQHMLAFEGGYHGRTLAVSAITSSYRYREPFGEFGDRAHFVPYPYPFRSPFRDNPEACESHYIQMVERLFEHEYTGAWNPKTKRSEFGAFFVEAVQGTGGYIVPPKGYFKRLAKLCRERGILFVDDEIQMGFYRTGKMWAIENFDVQPDILVFGKALTNGLNPLSGIWAREELISPDKFGPGMTHSTFSSNTLGTAIGLEVMKIFEEKDYTALIHDKGQYFFGLLKDLKSRHPEVGDVDALGMALRMEMCAADGFTPSRALADKMFQRGLEGNIPLAGKEWGLILDIGGYYKNVLTIAPSFEMSYEEMDLAHDLLDVLLKECRKA